MTRLRNAPLGRALIGLGLGAGVSAAYLGGLFSAAEEAAFATGGWLVGPRPGASGLHPVPQELYASVLIVLAVALMLEWGNRSLARKVSSGLVCGAVVVVVSLASVAWARVLVPLWPGLSLVALVFVVSVCLELAEASYLVDREARGRFASGAAAAGQEDLSPTGQVEATLQSVVRWYDLPAVALLLESGLRRSHLVVALGEGPAKWQQAPGLHALAQQALRARSPVLGKWPSALAQGGEWHALAVPVPGWAGQMAVLIAASHTLPVPQGALEFGVRAVRQLLAARMLLPEAGGLGPAPPTRPRDLPLPRQVAWLRSARLSRQRQAALAAAWRSAAHEAVVLFDLAGRPVLWNRKAELLFGDGDDGLSQGHLVSLLSRSCGLNPTNVRDAATAVLLHGAPFICDLEDARGHQNYVATLSQVAVDGEAPGGLVLRGIDVTGICRPARVEARLMGIAAHEMRTPLTSILGYAEMLLQQTERQSHARRYAAALHRQAQRLEAVVEELLAVTRLEAGRDELTLEPVDLSALVRHVVASSELLAADHGVTLTCGTLAAELAVRGDALKLERVVENLVVNAIKYSPPGASVRVSVRRSADRAVVVVEDTGYGIPSEDAPHVFEKFYRARTAHTRSVPGTGLGLAIVKLIAEAHEGDVVLRTAPGVGSTFTVSLPIQGPRRSQAITAA